MTGVVHASVGGQLADFVFHDLAGWLLMPLALHRLDLLSRLPIEPALAVASRGRSTWWKRPESPHILARKIPTGQGVSRCRAYPSRRR
jgi:hypothetical protein